MDTNELVVNSTSPPWEGEDSVGPTTLPSSLMESIQLVYILICISGLIGNTLVAYVVLRFSKMQTVTNVYILNLALADECFLIGIPFLVVTSITGDWIFGTVMCKAYLTSTSITQFTSSIFLTIMSFDRYIAVCHSIRSSSFRTTEVAKWLSVTAWIVSACLMTPVFLFADTHAKPDGRLTCNMFWPIESSSSGKQIAVDLGNSSSLSEIPSRIAPDDQPTPPAMPADAYSTSAINGQTVFTLYTFALGFAGPLVMVMAFYIMVIKKLNHVRQQRNNASEGRRKSHRKVTKLVLTVITVYVFCWTPYWITQLSLIFTRPGHHHDNVRVVVMLLAGCLSYSNSAMNPVLYAFMSENFRKTFTKSCSCLLTSALARLLSKRWRRVRRWWLSRTRSDIPLQERNVDEQPVGEPPQPQRLQVRPLPIANNGPIEAPPPPCVASDQPRSQLARDANGSLPQRRMSEEDSADQIIPAIAVSAANNVVGGLMNSEALTVETFHTNSPQPPTMPRRHSSGEQ